MNVTEIGKRLSKSRLLHVMELYVIIKNYICKDRIITFLNLSSKANTACSSFIF